MNEKKLQELFEAARRETGPEPPAGFATAVMRALRREAPLGREAAGDLLNALFPRVALAAAGFIGLCVLADVCGSARDRSGMWAAMNEIRSQWLFTAE